MKIEIEYAFFFASYMYIQAAAFYIENKTENRISVHDHKFYWLRLIKTNMNTSLDNSWLMTTKQNHYMTECLQQFFARLKYAIE